MGLDFVEQMERMILEKCRSELKEKKENYELNQVFPNKLE